MWRHKRSTIQIMLPGLGIIDYQGFNLFEKLDFLCVTD